MRKRTDAARAAEQMMDPLLAELVVGERVGALQQLRTAAPSRTPTARRACSRSSSCIPPPARNRRWRETARAAMAAAFMGVRIGHGASGSYSRSSKPYPPRRPCARGRRGCLALDQGPGGCRGSVFTGHPTPGEIIDHGGIERQSWIVAVGGRRGAAGRSCVASGLCAGAWRRRTRLGAGVAACASPAMACARMKTSNDPLAPPFTVIADHPRHVGHGAQCGAAVAAPRHAQYHARSAGARGHRRPIS